MEITNIAWVYRTGQAKGREIPISSITLNSDYKVKSVINIHISFHLFDKITSPARFRRVEKLIAISNSSSPARFLRMPDVEEDGISQLPDEVLRRIL
ncbi:hypothetical protein ACJIZ3_023417 [Penstemon smallii]|uniref:F-box domain-containing protein n=1 Tax=Penstemon smallii TaxID=265156 RepID=A0ABD3TQD1_9LAMI